MFDGCSDCLTSYTTSNESDSTVANSSTKKSLSSESKACAIT